MISMRFNSPASANAMPRPSGDQNCDEFVRFDARQHPRGVRFERVQPEPLTTSDLECLEHECSTVRRETEEVAEQCPTVPGSEISPAFAPASRVDDERSRQRDRQSPPSQESPSPAATIEVTMHGPRASTAGGLTAVQRQPHVAEIARADADPSADIVRASPARQAASSWAAGATRVPCAARRRSRPPHCCRRRSGDRSASRRARRTPARPVRRSTWPRACSGPYTRPFPESRRPPSWQDL